MALIDNRMCFSCGSVQSFCNSSCSGCDRRRKKQAIRADKTQAAMKRVKRKSKGVRRVKIGGDS